MGNKLIVIIEIHVKGWADMEIDGMELWIEATDSFLHGVLFYGIFFLGVRNMEVKEILHDLREREKMTQDELAERVFVTRQAVSRWERGETVPNTETLKQLSKLFNVSINTLLGSPQKLVCQCCGMPLDDTSISRELDGTFNEEYCKWCYTDGHFVYTDISELTDFLVGHMSSESWPADEARAFFEEQLPKLRYWSERKS